MEREPSTVRLLTDAPSQTDDLGSHGGVAAALATLLREQIGGRAVALEGGWGTGKSSVVTQLKEQFASATERVFVFDAWAHQGDPLRRSFLEALSENLMATRGASTAWVTEDEWRPTLESLAGRRRTSVRKTHTRVRDVAKLAALGALAVPLGAVVLSEALNDSTRLDDWWWLVLGVVLVCAPALGVLVGLAIRRFNSDKRAEDQKLEIGVLDPLVGNQNIDEYSDSWESGEPTSIEFESTFRDLMGHALSDESRRLVIVLDNLDRATPEAALGILATMQTFVGTSDQRKEAWHDRLWIVVPFDREGMERLWTTSDGDRDVAMDQFDKLFDVTLRVPPLRLSDVRTFLSGLLREALPETDAVDRELATRAFSTFRRVVSEAADDLPTPRKLKQLVNQVVALRLQAPEVPIATLMYFALCCRYHPDIEGWLLGSDELIHFERLLGPNVHRTVAALHYGRSEEESLQLLLSNQLETALGSSDAEALQGLMSTPGAWDVAEQLDFESWWTDDDGETVGLAVAALLDADLLDESPDAQRVVHRIQQSCQTHAKLRPRTERAGFGLGTLAASPTSPVTPADLSTYVTDPADAEPRLQPADFVPALIGIHRGLGTRSAEFADAGPAIWNVGPADEQALAEAMARLPEECWPLVATRNGASDTDSAVAESAKSVPVGLPGVVKVLLARYPGSTYPKILAMLRSAFAGDLTAVQMSAALDTLDALGAPGAKEVEAARMTGALFHHYGVAAADPQGADVAARILYVCLKADPALGPPQPDRQAPTAHAAMGELAAGPDDKGHQTIVASLARVLDQANDADLLVALGGQPTTAKLAAALLARLAADPESQLLTADVLATSWGLFVQLVGEEGLTEAVDRVRAEGAFETAARKVSLSGANASLAMRVLEGDLQDPDSVAAWSDLHLSTLAQQDWTDALATGNDHIGIVVARVDAGLPPQLGSAYEDTLQALIVSAGPAVPRYEDRLSTLIDALDPKRLSVFLRSCAKTLADGDVDLTLPFLNSWGAALAERDDFLAADPVLALAEKLLNTADPERVGWIASLIERNPQIPVTATAGQREHLEAELEEAQNAFTDATPEQVREAVEALASAVSATPGDADGRAG